VRRRDCGEGETAECDQDCDAPQATLAWREPSASLAPPMPIYEYKCPNGHLFDAFHGMTEAGPTVCTVCGEGPLQVVLHPVAVHYKGSGFYSTDYGRKSKQPPKDGASGDSAGSSSGGGDSGGGSESGGSGGDSGGSTGTSEPKKTAEA
jgi:putative FmdB family regulatory protein